MHYYGNVHYVGARAIRWSINVAVEHRLDSQTLIFTYIHIKTLYNISKKNLTNQLVHRYIRKSTR